MRVAYVCTDPGVPVFGGKGGSIHVQEVVRALVRRGCDVTIVARRRGGQAPPGLEGVGLVELSRAPSGQTVERERFLLQANDDLAESLAEAGPFDLVYERHALWSYGAMEHARGAGVPGVLEVNAPLVEEQSRFRSLTLLEEAEEAADRCFGAASSLVAVSRPLADWLEGRASAAGRVHVVPNGVDTARFAPDVAPALPDAERVTIGFVGSLRLWHGVERLVSAFAALRGVGLPVRLLIVGDGPARGEVESACAGLGGSVVLTGAVEPERVPALLASMDIAVAPYPEMERFYFSPLKLFEYMASGRAIVASACGQVRDVIRHGETGLLVGSDDTGALVAALRCLVADGALRRTLGGAARREAVAEHRWDSVAGRILDLSRLGGRAAV